MEHQAVLNKAKDRDHRAVRQVTADPGFRVLVAYVRYRGEDHNFFNGVVEESHNILYNIFIIIFMTSDDIQMQLLSIE